MRHAQLARQIDAIECEYQLRSVRGRTVMAFADETRARTECNRRGLRLFRVERRETEIPA